MKIGVVGLGLMGGSVAKAIRKHTDHTVWAYNRSPAPLDQAIEEGVVDAPLTDERLGQIDVLIVSLYPQASIDYIVQHAEKIAKNAVVVDFCGIKRSVCDAVAPVAQQYGFCFIGGHPMAGTERSGYDSARSYLFRGASMILTPGPDTKPERLEQLSAFFLSLGFEKIQIATPEEHDRMIAYTSQLAHVLSSAYVKTPSALHHRGFSANSFQDMTRVAYLNEDMWTELFLINGDYLADEVEGLSRRLQEYSAAIRTGNRSELHRLLKEGRICKEKTEQGGE
jgi:prephenate dehydrogenase